MRLAKFTITVSHIVERDGPSQEEEALVDSEIMPLIDKLGDVLESLALQWGEDMKAKLPSISVSYED